ncbi:hypothetical protein ALC62_07269 [Cyphomyrmex costatus]|uniref:Uncharacterized protein n=1 Tax=Cyphomyrmex costatus TaxID=456900 RepID=A0A195CML0_9HYME|nr:hypothetical protein ALC62_07269 [Cyphomyrmex costatus]
MPNSRVCACRKVETEKTRLLLFPLAEPPLFLALCLPTSDPRFRGPRDHVLRITGPSLLYQRCT